MDSGVIFVASDLTFRRPVHSLAVTQPDLQHILSHRHTLSSPPEPPDPPDPPDPSPPTVLISASFHRLLPPPSSAATTSSTGVCIVNSVVDISDEYRKMLRSFIVPKPSSTHCLVVVSFSPSTIVLSAGLAPYPGTGLDPNPHSVVPTVAPPLLYSPEFTDRRWPQISSIIHCVGLRWDLGQSKEFMGLSKADLLWPNRSYVLINYSPAHTNGVSEKMQFLFLNDATLRGQILGNNNLFTEQGGFVSSFQQRPLLCIFDRNFELSVGIQHDFRYQPLVHDVLALNLERFELQGVKKKTLVDPFWSANGSLEFPQVALQIETQLNKYKKDVVE
ncbi:hypothetical protein AALP_AAs55400U000100, partial [Arabis alpina]